MGFPPNSPLSSSEPYRLSVNHTRLLPGRKYLTLSPQPPHGHPGLLGKVLTAGTELRVKLSGQGSAACQGYPPHAPFETGCSAFTWTEDKKKMLFHTVFKQKCLFFSFKYTISWGVCATDRSHTRAGLQTTCLVRQEEREEGGFHHPLEPGTHNSQPKDQGAHYREQKSLTMVSWPGRRVCIIT